MNLVLSELTANQVLVRKTIAVCPRVQSLRHHLKSKRKEPFRKPVWQPTAPSKLFRIRQKPVLTEAEEQQRNEMDETYAIAIRSIHNYFRQEFYLPTLSAGGLPAELVRKEEVNQMQLIRENDEENKRVALMREERMARMEQLMDQKMIVEYLNQTRELKEKGQRLDAQVRQEVKRSATYITEETLDAAIEEALAHPISYDFALDIDGRIHSDQPLHPYALQAFAIPETNSNIKEMAEREEPPKQLEPKVVYSTQ